MNQLSKESAYNDQYCTQQILLMQLSGVDTHNHS